MYSIKLLSFLFFFVFSIGLSAKDKPIFWKTRHIVNPVVSVFPKSDIGTPIFSQDIDGSFLVIPKDKFPPNERFYLVLHEKENMDNAEQYNPSLSSNQINNGVVLHIGKAPLSAKALLLKLLK